MQLPPDNNPRSATTIGQNIRRGRPANPIAHARITQLHRRHDPLGGPDHFGHGNPRPFEATTHDKCHLTLNNRLDQLRRLHRALFRVHAAVQQLAIYRFTNSKYILVSAARQANFFADPPSPPRHFSRDNRPLDTVTIFNSQAWVGNRGHLNWCLGFLGLHQLSRNFRDQLLVHTSLLLSQTVSSSRSNCVPQSSRRRVRDRMTA